MTGKHYFDSDSLSMQAEVIACEPSDNGEFSILLAATLFHPQGGGQPADTGIIGDARVLQVKQTGDTIVHITDCPVPLGFCEIAVDAETRGVNTRMHSAGHLIAVVIERMDWRAVKANHRPGEGRVVFEPANERTVAPPAEEIAQAVNNLIKQALPRQQTLENGTRLVTWGTLPAYACGGTHVTVTSLTGEVSITAAKFRKGTLSVSYELAE